MTRKVRKMRKIKYRAWDSLRGEYLSAGTVSIEIHKGKNPVIKKILDNSLEAEKGRFILEQYTGMEDSQGTDIYEGDVVIVRLADGESGMGVIDFVDGCFDILFLGLAYIDGKFCKRDYLKCWTINHAVTVIGNIHDKKGGE
jgi:hypothetical protein